MTDDLNLELAHAIAEARRFKVLTRYEARKLMLPALGLEDQDEIVQQLQQALTQAHVAAEMISRAGLDPQAPEIKSLIQASQDAWYAALQIGLVDESYPVVSTFMGYSRQPDTSETDHF